MRFLYRRYRILNDCWVVEGSVIKESFYDSGFRV